MPQDLMPKLHAGIRFVVLVRLGAFAPTSLRYALFGCLASLRRRFLRLRSSGRSTGPPDLKRDHPLSSSR